MKNSFSLPKCFTEVITHEHFNDCLEIIRECVRGNTSTRIILVTGPTGVGKSTLRRRVEEELTTISAQVHANNPEAVAFGSCSVGNRGQTAFSWKDTYIQVLRSLHHPFADDLTRNAGRGEPRVADGLKPMSAESLQSASNSNLFRILQKTINRRKPLALLYDEAHHFLRISNTQSLLNQLEHIKYLADETNTLHILFGTYELIKLMDLSSALIRRREVVHFPRYVYDPGQPEESLRSFGMVLKTFAVDLDSVCAFKLLKESAVLYQGSVGCIGVLRDWLCRCYEAAMQSREKKITLSLLKRKMPSPGDRLKLIDEIRDGEDYFANRKNCEKEFLEKIGLVAPTVAAAGRCKRRRKPGERNPHNDPVGLESLTAQAAA